MLLVETESREVRQNRPYVHDGHSYHKCSNKTVFAEIILERRL